jgi:hypothetical protein
MLNSFHHLFWRRFLFRGDGCSSFIFFCLLKKINVLQRQAYKNYDKKVVALQAKSVISLCVELGGILSSSQKEKDLFFTASVFRYCKGCNLSIADFNSSNPVCL